MKKPANRSTIESAPNYNPNILYLDSPHDENIAIFLEALAKNACDADEDITPIRKQKTWGIMALLLDKNKDVAPSGKKRTWEKVTLLLDKDKNIGPAVKK